MKYVPLPRKHISLVKCVPLPRNHISLAKCVPLPRKHILLVKWVIREKIHTPTTEGMLENLTGGGVNGSGNSDVRGGSEPKNTSSGVTFDFIDVSIASINKFSKNCSALSNFIILSNYRPVTTFFFKFPSIGSSSLLS